MLENYFATDAYGASYVGLNFAVATPVSDHVELIFSGQTGVGAAPQRFEASSRVRVGNKHRVGVSAAGARFATPVWTNRVSDRSDLHGQVSLRAIDEWIVRDGIVIVMGLDYSRFLGAGGAHAGRITVDSTPGHGTTFRITLPTARVRARLQAVGD